MIHLIIHLVIYLQGMQYIISHDPFLVSCEKNFCGKAASQQVSWPQSQRRWWQFAPSSGAMICWWSPCLPSRLWEQALNFEFFFGGCRVWGDGASIVLFASTPVQPTRIHAKIWNTWWDRDFFLSSNVEILSEESLDSREKPPAWTFRYLQIPSVLLCLNKKMKKRTLQSCIKPNFSQTSGGVGKDCNGHYIRVGTHNGMPKYRLEHGDATWILMNSSWQRSTQTIAPQMQALRFWGTSGTRQHGIQDLITY